MVATGPYSPARRLSLEPPQPRAGGETRQIMAIGADGWRMSQVAGCIERAEGYHLTPADARDIVDHQIEVISRHWTDVCDQAELSKVDRQNLWHRQFLNP